MKVLSLIRKSRWSCTVLVAALIPSVSLVTIPVQANPAGATVVHGNIDIQGIGTGSVNINQASQNAIINWQDFSINAGETTHFNQVAGGVVLNRVVGVNPTSIYGTLSATGTVFVVNPNGILVGPSGVIDVGGALTLSTLDLSNSDFLNGGANSFYGGGVTGVVNRGSIRAANGDVMFLGGFAHNFNSIEATRGAVALAAGGEMIVGQSGDATISVISGSSYDGIGVNQSGSVTGAATELQSHGNAFALAINNGGITRATGGYRKNGRSVLRAMGSSSRVVNTGTIEARNPVGSGGEVVVEAGRFENSGMIDAAGIGANDGGSINVIAESLYFDDDSKLLATSVSHGGSVNLDAESSAEVGGSIDVSSMMQNGGNVTITGDMVEVDAEILATGGTGGIVRVGGDFQGSSANGIKASSSSVIGQGASFNVSSALGDAGKIIVWSDGDTIFEGEALAQATGAVGNGGLIEISGKQNLTFAGHLSANSLNGKAGAVLFDPGTLVIGNTTGTSAIAAGPNVIASGTINDLLQGGTSVLIATQYSETEDSNIIFANTGIHNERDDAIQWTNSNASFGAFAAGNIVIETHIRTSGAGSINLIAGWGGTEEEVGLAAAGALDSTALSTLDVEALWERYVEGGSFGENNGSVIIGGASLNRHVVVGSRYGNTNLAGDSLSLITPQGNTGESDYVHLGFRDTGQVFAVRGTNGYGNGTLDLNDRGYEVDNDVIVGVNDPTYYRDINSDGIADGVYAINSYGVLDGVGAEVGNSTTDDSATLIPFSNHFMSERTGNYWWQQIDGENPDPLGLGGLAPEHGAGGRSVTLAQAALDGGATAAQAAAAAIDHTQRADINVAMTGGVVMKSGGRHQDYSQIGHGGDATGWFDDRGNTDGNLANNVSGQNSRNFDYNGGDAESATSIARLAPVYGNINILSGVDPETVVVDFSAEVDNLLGTVNPGLGGVYMEAWQNYLSSNRIGQESVNADPNNSESYVQIGHLGTGQFGVASGHISVTTGGDVTILAGAHSRNHATIGHTVNGYAYWDPPANEQQQVRFYANNGDFNNPHLRKGTLFAGDDVADTVYDEGHDGGTFDNDFFGQAAELGTGSGVVVDGFSGSVRKDLIGDIRVESYGGQGITIHGGETPYFAPDGVSDPTSNGSNGQFDGIYRQFDRRFAAIGHGGASFDTWTEPGTEEVRLAIIDGRSESRQIQTTGGTQISRTLTFMNTVGDIEVYAHNGGVEIKAGNDVRDYAKIGHGGAYLSDYETSNVAIGDITVEAARDLLVQGGGETLLSRNYGNTNTNVDTYRSQSFAQIGHGGYRSGFQYFGGDIAVDVGGKVTVTAGRYSQNFAQIGHQGTDSWGQVAGSFNRSESYDRYGDLTVNPSYDSLRTNETYDVSVTDSTLSLNYEFDSLRDDGVATTFDIEGYTANVDVTAGNGVELNHLRVVSTRNFNMNTNASNIDQLGNDLSQAQIGHGGRNVDGLRDNGNNASYDYAAKVGDISVIATGGDIEMTGGNAHERWSRIGHGGSDSSDRMTGNGILELGGDITVTAELGNIYLNGEANGLIGIDIPETTGDGGGIDYSEIDPTLVGIIDPNPREDGIGTGNYVYGEQLYENLNGVVRGELENTFDGVAVDVNGLAIGHGTMLNQSSQGNLQIVSGGDINGITTDSTISVNAAIDMSVIGGWGTVGSHSQVGHGTSSLSGNSSSDFFNGSIFVDVGNNLLVQGSSNGYVVTDSVNLGGTAVFNAAAFIGNGGVFQDVDSIDGSISVYVGNDLEVTGGKRDEANEPLAANSGGFTFGNFAQIGHVASENGAIFDTNNNDAVNADMTGDIIVVVDNDLTMTGGQTPNDNSGDFVDDVGGRQGQIAAYSQIGHGGAGVSGIMEGSIEVLVGNNMETVDGTLYNYVDASNPGAPVHNYVKIGHGDWMREGFSNTNAAIFRGSGSGLKSGDIYVLVGESAEFEHTLIGHVDPTLESGPTISEGVTHVAVSRNDPFDGGTGTLTAQVSQQSDYNVAINGELGGTGQVAGTVFSGDSVELYMPSRDQNAIDQYTRINSATSLYTGNHGGGYPSGTGIYAGESDEVFLTPDLWWLQEDDVAIATERGYDNVGIFPGDATSGQGGSIALVNSSSSGGLPNLVDLTTGALGSSPNVASAGVAAYTIFYDAVEMITEDTFPYAPAGPGPDLTPFAFATGSFDMFDRPEDGFNGIFGDHQGSLANLPGPDNGIRLGVPGQVMEEFLDMVFGPRTSGDSRVSSGGALEAVDPDAPGSRSSSEVGQEDLEELERQANQENRPPAVPGGVEAYIYVPGASNPYSSFSIFGDAE